MRKNQAVSAGDYAFSYAIMKTVIKLRVPYKGW
jgi:hypothetical protein